MNNIDLLASLDNRTFQLLFLIIAVFRIYLEVIGFKFDKLPVTKILFRDNAIKFHKMGFYFSLGYFILFAPSFLLSA